MDCNEVSERLSAYFDAELDIPSAELMHDHLERCSPCAEQLRWFADLRNQSAHLGDYDNEGQPPSWNSIEQRLESETVNVAPQWQRKEVSWLQMCVVLALAASIVLFFSLTDAGRSARTQLAQVHFASIDFQDIIHRFSGDPHAAMETLSQKYAGREVTLAEVEAKLGYRPMISAMPTDEVQLVSTRLLQFPNCQPSPTNSKHDQIAHNCVACVCERNDGSKFLVVEHCHAQEVSFGELPTQWVHREDQPFQLLKTPKSVTASWQANDRRVTAIGLQSDDEAHALVNAAQAFDEV